jgi:hypothetical protein
MHVEALSESFPRKAKAEVVKKRGRGIAASRKGCWGTVRLTQWFLLQLWLVQITCAQDSEHS